MSMPSSRLDVATSAGSRPALRSSSMARRCSRAMLPWWALTRSSPASSLSRCASRSESRRLLVKTIVLLVLADELEDRAGGSPARCSSAGPGWSPGRPAARRGAGSRRSRPCRRPGRRPGGRAALRVPASTIATSRFGPTPPRNRAIASSGRCVADRPIRCIGSASAGRSALEAFQAQGEVGAPLRARDRVDLVDDDVLDAAEDLAGLARQHAGRAIPGS